jgi:murein DD-endopeptidase MepM/ murein hydrolase activator NlpD
MPKFAISTDPQRPETPDTYEAWSEEITGPSVSGRVLDQVIRPAPPARLPSCRVGVRGRTLRLAVLGVLAVILAFAGPSVVQAAAAASASGNYAHPCPKCRLTQGFKPGVHNGLDLAAPVGTPIYAAAAGTVTAAGPRDPAGFGQVVYIDNNDGTVAWYGHIDTWLVHVGDRVGADQQIATVGNRGNATGPHLHFEIHAPDPINPASWLRRHGINI